MVPRVSLIQLLATTQLALGARYLLNVTSASPYAFSIVTERGDTIISNVAVLSGRSNDTTEAIGEGTEGVSVSAELISPSVARVQVNSSLGYIGAVFDHEEEVKHYGVWAYPWNNSILMPHISFDLKGVQSNPGVSFSSARTPFFISSTGYAVYTDTLAMGSYSFSDADKTIRFIFNTTNLDYYLILPEKENDIKSLLGQHSRLSTNTALWSSKAYGPMFWHDDFQREAGWPEGIENSQAFVQDVADKLREHNIRATTIMIDRPYGTGETGWGNFDFDAAYWPEWKLLVPQLSRQGLELQLWVANRAVPGQELYNDGRANGWLFDEIITGDDSIVAYNLSIPEAYDYVRQRTQFFAELGVKGYKIDRGEEDEMPSWEQNIQSFLYHKLLFEGQAARQHGGTPRDGPVEFYNFARNIVGQARKYAGVWNGDTASTVLGLDYSVKSGILAGLLGFPVWGSDCGGYQRTPGQPQLPTEALWARWMWFSAFSPVYELMLNDASIPWYDYSDELIEVLKTTAQLHHELIPFIQSYVFASTADGLPVIRALFLEAPEDEKAWDVQNAYFFGREFLVAPITADSGSISVYLPKGARYVEYFGKKDTYQGGQVVNITRNFTSTPVFVREGSIIPRGDLFRSNNRWDKDWKPWLNVEVYPSLRVKHQTFQYYDEATNKAILIELWADEREKTVRVRYGPLGTNGKVVIYLKNGSKEFKLKPKGGEERLKNVQTLFD